MVSLSPWASPKSQNVVPVIVEKPPLAFREGSYRDPLIDRNAHPVKGCSVSYRRNDELAVTLERDKAFVEEMVDRRREQQAVLAAQPLVIGAVRQGLMCSRSSARVSLPSSLDRLARYSGDLIYVRRPGQALASAE